MDADLPHRRGTQRVRLFELGILEPDSREPIGLILDVSLSGAKTLCPGTFRIGASHRFRLELPEGIVDENSIEVEATVRWCSESRLPRTSVVGWEFSGVMPIEVSHAIGELVLAAS